MTIFLMMMLQIGMAIMVPVVFPKILWMDWFSHVVLPGAYGIDAIDVISPASPWNQSINGFFARLFMLTEYSNALLHSPLLTKIMTYFFSVLAILVTSGICFVSARKLDKDHLINIEFSLFLLTIYLVSPFSWDHHLVFVIPAAIFVGELVINTKYKMLFLIIAGSAVLIIALHIPLGHPALADGIFVLGISIKLYAVSILWGYLIYKIIHLLKKKSHFLENSK